MRRPLIVMLAAVAALTALSPARAATGVDRLIEGSYFCDGRSQFRDGPASVDGPASQLAVHTEVFGPAFARACRIGSGLVTYLGTGEQAGINAIVDRNPARAFGTADIPLSPVEKVQADLDLRAPDRRNRTTTVEQIPLMVSVTAVAYNLTSCSIPRLNLRSPVLSAIFSGTVTRWNDPLLVRDNPALGSCAYPIRLIKRADFAGSTATFKDYLSKRNPQWAYYKQPAQNQVWPTLTNACPALDEDGMADCILSTQNSIGYIQYHVAKTSHLRTAYLDNISSQTESNPSVTFLPPSPAGCTEAAGSAVILPARDKQQIKLTDFYTYETTSFTPTRLDWSTVSLTDSSRGYPLCSFGYAFIYISTQTAYFGQEYSPHTARTAVDYLWTAVGADAQSKLPAFDYGSLPENVREVARVGLSEIRFGN